MKNKSMFTEWDLERKDPLDNRIDYFLAVYIRAVNRIDDYFEYSNESKKDRKKVHEILDKLMDDIRGCEERFDYERSLWDHTQKKSRTT